MKCSFLISAPPDGTPPPLLAPRPEAPGVSTPLHFGDPVAERLALEGDAALLDGTDGDRVVVEGADAAAFLQRLLANDVRGLAVGQENENLLLSPKGRVVSCFQLARTGAEAFSLELPPDQAGHLFAALDAYLFGEAVRITDQSAEAAPLVLAGPRAAHVLEALGAEAPASGTRRSLSLEGTTALVRHVSGPGGATFAVDGGPGGAPALWSALRAAGAVPVGLEAREVVRIESGTPLFGTEIDDTVVPQEAGLEQAFALDKGCYIGQEVVAKIDTYGGLNRKLVGWRLADDTPREKGTPVHDAETAKEVGSLTSWVRSPRLGTGLALGYVKLRALSGTPVFSVAGAPAALVALPLAR